MGFDTSPGPYGRHAAALTDAGLGGLLDGSHGAAWVRNLRIPTVDFATIQVDPDALGLGGDGMAWANLGAAWIRGHAGIAALEGKPLVISLARLPGRVELAPRRQALQAWMDEVQSLDLAGFAVGNFYPAGAEGADPAGFTAAEGAEGGSAGNPYGDLIQALAAALAR
ncbi:MAG: hypothetical protein R3F43_01150 [bacterium]